MCAARRATLVTLPVLCLLLAACQVLPASLQPLRLPATPTPLPAKTVSLIAGPPIVSLPTTARLPSTQDGRTLSAAGSYHGSIIVTAAAVGDRSSPVLYELWDPASGALSPIAGWQSAPGSNERLLGTSGDWALLARDATQPANSSQIVLRNIATGEVRQIATVDQAGLRPRASIGDGWVAWVAGSGGRELLHVYAISTSSDTIVPARVPAFGGLALGNGFVAWAQSGGNQGARIVLRELPSGATQTVPTGSVTSVSLANSGRSLVWLENGSGSQGLFERDLGSAETDQLVGGQGIGFGLSTSGPYIAWQPRPGGGSATAGYYNLQTHELRLVDKPQSPPTFAAAIGNWFVWSLGARPGGFAAAGNPTATPADDGYYAVRLAP